MTEKNYRTMYNWIFRERLKDNRQLLYELNFKEYESKVKLPSVSIIQAVFTNTLIFSIVSQRL